MIEYTTGNLLESKAEALVNTVNTVGVMGKGIALLFKEQFSENFKLYKKACQNAEVRVGTMFITHTQQILNPQHIINFPTKKDWRKPSQYAFVAKGLEDLVLQIQRLNIQSIAIPPLGCGNGGLEWTKVKLMIEDAMEQLAHVKVYLYEPSEVIPAKKEEDTNLKLTESSAMLLALLLQYQELGYSLTLLEVQKLAYFLQESGEDLGLRFKAHYYGTYADNLRKWLEHLEGTYLWAEKRIADSKPDAEIELNLAKIEKIKNFVEQHCSEVQKNRLKSVAKSIRGYETPFGMELLSTVHWAKNKSQSQELSQIQDLVYNWEKKPDRKQQLFSPKLIQKALEQLVNT